MQNEQGKEEKQEYLKTKDTLQTSKQKWHLIATALKRIAINLDCKAPWECGDLWCHSLKERNHTEDPKQSVLHRMSMHIGTTDQSRIRINTAGICFQESISYLHSLTQLVPTAIIKIQIEWWLFFNFLTEISEIPPWKTVI